MRSLAIIAALAGLMGAAGVALAARAAHGGSDPNLMLAAMFLVIHAAALPGLAAFGRSCGRPHGFALAGGMLALGASLFSGDLAMRGLAGSKLFDFAAPIGGSLLILGWLALMVAGLMAAFQARQG